MNWVVFDTGEQELYKLLHLQRQQEGQRHALQHDQGQFLNCQIASACTHSFGRPPKNNKSRALKASESS
jgi:hypothetical protein